MAKISDEARKDFAEAVKPYQSKIAESLNFEKSVLNEISRDKKNAPYKKLELCEEMIYISSLYMAQNSLALKILSVRNNDILNEARKILYKSIIYLEELVTNIIDIPYSELEKNYDAILDFPVEKRYYLVRKMGLAIDLLENAFGDISKWTWSFVELKGRFVVCAKNLIDMRKTAKIYFNPGDADYEVVVLYIRLLIKQLEQSANNYQSKYELSTRRLDDMRSAIKFLLARHKLALALNDASGAEKIKKKAIVWKEKMNADQKTGSSR